MLCSALLGALRCLPTVNSLGFQSNPWQFCLGPKAGCFLTQLRAVTPFFCPFCSVCRQQDSSEPSTGCWGEGRRAVMNVCSIALIPALESTPGAVNPGINKVLGSPCTSLCSCRDRGWRGHREWGWGSEQGQAGPENKGNHPPAGKSSFRIAQGHFFPACCPQNHSHTSLGQNFKMF